MKLVIDISKDAYENVLQRSTEIQAEGFVLENAVLNATPLDDVKAEMFKAYKYVNMYSCGDRVSCFASMVCKILDNIGKGE